MTAEFFSCSSCGSTHMRPVPCGLTWKQRMRGVRLDPRAQETRSKRRYWDQESLDQQFGGSTAQERKEQMYDETDGVGFIEMNSDGLPTHVDRKTGNQEVVEPKKAQKLMGVTGQRDDAE